MRHSSGLFAKHAQMLAQERDSNSAWSSFVGSVRSDVPSLPALSETLSSAAAAVIDEAVDQENVQPATNTQTAPPSKQPSANVIKVSAFDVLMSRHSAPPVAKRPKLATSLDKSKYVVAAAGSPSNTSKREFTCVGLSPSATVPPKSVQTYLDAGQASIGERTCPQCRMVYYPGVDEDERQHKQFCETRRLGPAVARIGANVPVVSTINADDDSTSCIVRLPLSMVASLSWSQALLERVDVELGFDTSLNAVCAEGNECSAEVLFAVIHHKRAVACLVVEPVSRAYPVLPMGVQSSTNQNRAIVECDLSRPALVSLGVRKIWVLPHARQRGFARALLDAARAHFVYGAQTIPLAEVAFSQPTEAGAALARKYFGCDEFLVYSL